MLVGGIGASLLFLVSATAEVVGTQTISNASHYGYYGFPSQSALNTKATVGPFNGVARVIRASGTITKIHPDAWASSIRVYPTGGGLAFTQPWFQFTNQRAFTGTIPVSATIYIPGGLNLSSAMTWEMFSIDSEQFVPGLDARSTITYTFDNAFPPGTAEYSGRIETSDPRFNRPIQFPSSSPSGWTAPMLSGRFPHYDVQPFHVAAAGRYTIACANEFESAGVLYQHSFDPANSLNNVMWAFGQTGNVLRNNTFNSLPFNDDATGGTVIEADLLPGVQYYFVTTAFAAPGDVVDGGPFVGRYSNVIAGDGQVWLGLIPEPSGLLTLSGLLGLLLRRRTS
jgi:hypothetical protein